MYTCFIVFFFGDLALMDFLEGSPEIYSSFEYSLSAALSPRSVDWPSDCFTRCPGYRLYSCLVNCLVNVV